MFNPLWRDSTSSTKGISLVTQRENPDTYHLIRYPTVGYSYIKFMKHPSELRGQFDYTRLRESYGLPPLRSVNEADSAWLLYEATRAMFLHGERDENSVAIGISTACLEPFRDPRYTLVSESQLTPTSTQYRYRSTNNVSCQQRQS